MTDQKPPLANYLDALEHDFLRRETRRHTYRPALKRLLQALFGASAVTDVPQVDEGVPDLVIVQAQAPIGVVITVDLGTDLNRAEAETPLRALLHALPHVLVTDYIEFRQYIHGQRRESAHLGEQRDGKLKRGSTDTVERLLKNFISFTSPPLRTASELANRLAAPARELRSLIVRNLTGEAPSVDLRTQANAFRLAPEPFADAYTQMVVYGLFAARLRHEGPGHRERFRRRDVQWDLPPTMPFLREAFQHILGTELDPRVGWLVDVLAEVLAQVNTTELLRDMSRRKRQEDPLTVFHETFLAEYDPSQRGSTHLPESVVGYLVRSVDHVLKKRFKRALGLADPQALFLDPAVGRGTLLYFVIQQAHDLLRQQRQLGSWDEYMRDHLLPRLFGFEERPAFYALAHLKLALQLQETGYRFDSLQRLGVYLIPTSTTITPIPPSDLLTLVIKEANEALLLKDSQPIQVIMSAPLENDSDENSGMWLTDSLQSDWLEGDNRTPFQKDYLKFLRFAQWRLERTGSGTAALVTDSGYLDNPDLRAARRSLLHTFSDIYVLNLHGGSGETAPDGSPDDNLFPVEHGVTISIFVKEAHKDSSAGAQPRTALAARSPAARLHYADLWGGRAHKIEVLTHDDLLATEWQELRPQAPDYLFVTHDTDRLAEYTEGWKITDVMPISLPGYQPSCAAAYEREGVVQRLRDLRDAHLSDAQLRERYGLVDTPVWKLSEARTRLRQTDDWANTITECLVRPFDRRPCSLDEIALGSSSGEVWQLADAGNLYLALSRQPAANDWHHALVADAPTPSTYVESAETTQVFPVYLYPANGKIVSESAFAPGKHGRRPNLHPDFVLAMAERLNWSFVPDGRGDGKHTFGPEDVLAYAYALFYSPAYRQRYAEFLKVDVPRVPLTSDKKLFRGLARKGRKLVNLHLMRKAGLWRLITGFTGTGRSLVEQDFPRYLQLAGEHGGRVYINENKYFEGVPRAVWEFPMGGYPVLDSWLKDRRGRILTFEDTLYYQRIIVALNETLQTMTEIDQIIPALPLV